jgi:ribosomal protein S18 acetylase RimI-like enzyme
MTGRNDRTRSDSASAPVSVEAVATETLLAELVGQVVDVWADAHGLGRASATRREFGSERVPRHAGREGFRFLGAFDSQARLVGFVYGYTGGPGQWWYDKVAGGLDDARRAEWLEPAHFELTELAVERGSQGQGIGTRLHDAVLEDLPHDRALLSALADNARVIRFYERRGWRVLLPELRFEPGRPLFAILGRDLRRR